MMRFDFQCGVCEAVETVKGTIGKVPVSPLHCQRKMKRLYAIPKFHMTWGRADYLSLAYEGKEKVPGLTTEEVRETLDTMPKIPA